MIKINKFRPVNKEVLVVRSGVTYRVLDLGGSKLEVRVKSPKELARDIKAFQKYKNKWRKALTLSFICRKIIYGFDELYTKDVEFEAVS